MNIYLRKIKKHDISHQISITQEVLKNFFGVFKDKEEVEMVGKKSSVKGKVSFLLATDPRFGGDIKRIITEEGGMILGDILLFIRNDNKFIIEVIKKNDPRFDVFDKIMDEERHLIINIDDNEIDENFDLSKMKPRQRIFFGAPGTGKSFKLNEEAKEFGNNYERVTFHPDYSYANFVGTYKPIPITKGKYDGEELDSSTRSIDDENTEDSNGITYDFVPGPFMNVLVKAIESNEKDSDPQMYLLIIEEINRANTAAVFGDVFQLLDRKNGISEYGISPSKEIKKYLSNKLNKSLNEINEIRIPDNMFIWATMNSADQGVFPMDTAFKRRWDFEYIGINENEDIIKDYTVKLGTEVINWNNFRKSINKWLVSHGVNEDKLLGPFFIDYKSLLTGDKDSNILDSEKFKIVFKNKVLMYLYEDAARHKKDIFRNGDNILLSEVFKNFDEEGVRVFNNEIVNELKRDEFVAKIKIDEYDDDSHKSSMIYETPDKEETINEMREVAEKYDAINDYETEDNI